MFVLNCDGRVSDIMTPEEAVEILENKITAMEEFNVTYPGYSSSYVTLISADSVVFCLGMMLLTRVFLQPGV